MKRVAKKPAPRRASTVIDPYLPKSGNLGYRVSHYELALEYKVVINRLSGSATITAEALTELDEFTLDFSDAMTVSKVLVNGKRAAHFACRERKLRIRLSSPLASGAAMSVVVHYHGSPRPLRSLWGDVGFEELTNGALVAGQPNGAALVVPLRRPPQRQSLLPHSDQRRKSLPGGRQRPAGVAAAARGTDRVDLRTARADLDLPRSPCRSGCTR